MQRKWPIILSLCAVLLVSCSLALKSASTKSAPGDDPFVGIQREYDAYLKERTPEKELQKNLEEGVLCFYCWGSVANGYHYPGLTQEQVDRLVIQQNVVVRVYWRDDPIDVLRRTEPFESMASFVARYNALVLAHLKTEHNPEGSTQKVLWSEADTGPLMNKPDTNED